MNAFLHLTPGKHLRQDRQQSGSVRNSRIVSIRAQGLGLLMAGAAASALAAGETLSVTEKIDLAAAPAQTWETIKDFNGWQAWHPAFASTKITGGKGNAEGTVRVLTTRDGARFTEVLVSHNAAARTYRYRITESPLPITGYISTLEVKPNKGGSSVVWSSNFKVEDGASQDEVKKMIAGVYRAGLDNLGSVVK
jgi:Polyketide cyclase / dehydrase and lipid transport